MKIVVTYESTDISRLIRQDLAQQGITALDSDIKYAKGSAVVSVEVTRDDVVPVPAASVVEAASPPVLSVAPPPLTVVDGGNAPVDMDAILRESKKHAANPGKFPTPERQLMDGESFDYPGGDKR